LADPLTHASIITGDDVPAEASSITVNNELKGKNKQVDRIGELFESGTTIPVNGKNFVQSCAKSISSTFLRHPQKALLTNGS
jgi:hypothetical protein